MAGADPARHRRGRAASGSTARGHAGPGGARPHADLRPPTSRHHCGRDCTAARPRGSGLGLCAWAGRQECPTRRRPDRQPVPDAAARRLRSRQPAAMAASLSRRITLRSWRDCGRARLPSARPWRAPASREPAPRPGRGGDAQVHRGDPVRGVHHSRGVGVCGSACASRIATRTLRSAARVPARAVPRGCRRSHPPMRPSAWARTLRRRRR